MEFQRGSFLSVPSETYSYYASCSDPHPDFDYNSLFDGDEEENDYYDSSYDFED
eukprot:CAMPEP_0168624636 /NCGR_PEP_ID=MMETSP0449_2-20121227/9533_1 /TAXON_ID=1082188 /ORGANISM="Strombidium rassoulzadegani, Strain ras09" /LENGTH=53 /DNA_ID=CAMNT_0008666235 /DNA_START=534 /DNA_END=695 /DNA_ORIENTATION=-